MTRVALILAGLMLAASAGAEFLRPAARTAADSPAFSLEDTIPRAFGDWQVEPQTVAQVVNPQTQELLDRLYSQIVARTYRHASGYRVMLSVAYGSDQRGALQAHKPEVCYPAQGFKLHALTAAALATEFGSIPATRLYASLGRRTEPVTYWFTVGDSAVRSAIDKRIVELRYALTGQIPDGLLFRVSSIDPEPENAYRIQDRFVNELLQALPPADRFRLSGLRAG
jgi:EpsI family protein